ncbi:hypothetical protein PAXRUDRAFT_402114 [Paxillus rubicundulus Ve08.2h10]|uniref:Uncharacterized protein n=1 Tax=Paxillus rubicundulus Ve08.2h10 TaxID=930991 RepID=A0A0D0DY80_9AGAM|nr:hypothetical protein PAXRUDRAFT_402114 [Paxillus rubicundulus Ve08.2h10]
MSPTPSAILTDALASFNKAATLAFTTAQEQARKDVTQAATETREARRERDEAVKALHTCRLAEQAWKQEAGVWKAAADQAELTVKHHLETIAQVRQEATQWKNQCLRLEETSRQEAISWKEQFIRVEKERCKLAQRVEEHVAEQLTGAQSHVSSTPYTPMMGYSAMGDLSASARLLQSLSPSVEELPPSKSTSSKSKPSSTARPRQGHNVHLPTPISEHQRRARQRAVQDPSSAFAPRTDATANGERQVLIRRVQAVVEIPVKEESVEREVSEPVASTSASASTSSASVPAPASKASKAPTRTTELSKAATRIKRKAPRKRVYVEIDDEDQPEADDNASEASQKSSAESGLSDSEGDDELLMGVEDNRKEVYGTKRVPKPAVHSKTPSRPPASTGKKRKVALPAKKSRPSTSSRV